MEFETGGGTKKAKNSIFGSTPLYGNNTEMYELTDSPIAMPTGWVVLKRRRPYIWEPDSLPYHVIDESKLRIWCPEWNKKYASRIDQFVPMRREAFTFKPNKTGDARLFRLRFMRLKTLRLMQSVYVTLLRVIPQLQEKGSTLHQKKMMMMMSSLSP